MKNERLNEIKEEVENGSAAGAGTYEKQIIVELLTEIDRLKTQIENPNIKTNP
jgi:hypothetical protein